MAINNEVVVAVVVGTTTDDEVGDGRTPLPTTTLRRLVVNADANDEARRGERRSDA
jgi:hypothetical protein